MSANLDSSMVRCTKCRRWWGVAVVYTSDPPNTKCPCGGELEFVDMEAHKKTLQYATYDPSKDKK